MVGHPKHLWDLSKIEADVRITCRQCGFEVDWAVSDLSAHLLAIGGNLTWSEVTRHLVCRRQGCGSTRLRAIPVPFARRQANLPRRIGKIDRRVVEVAVDVLAAATSMSAQSNVATVEVRLALLVVFIYTRDADLVRTFWDCAGDGARRSGQGLQHPLALIRQRLIELGWLAEAGVVERTPTWAWSSPAPPGWYVPKGGVREASGVNGDEHSATACPLSPEASG